jgi:hypothetical protein
LLAQGGADIRSTTVGYGAFSCAMAGDRLWSDWLVGRHGAATIVRCGGARPSGGKSCHNVRSIDSAVDHPLTTRTISGRISQGED